MTADPAAQFPLGVSELASGLRSGIHRVIRQQELLNRINVFPVADGDTGTNLCLSLGATLNTLLQPGSHQMGHFLAGLADQLLDNARGNSGAILAQFFQGLSDSAEDLAEFTAQSLSDAVVTGNRYARDALAAPREGTILSVIDVFACSLHAHVREDPGTSPGASLKRALSAMQEALARTEFQLDVLKKAGVVDAGAQGFVTLMEGVTEYLVTGEVTEAPDSATTIASVMTSDTEAHADLTFRYCTECIVTGDNIDRRKLREQLSEHGDSLVLAGTRRKAKIHIHVNEPDVVFSLAGQYGELSHVKADDMDRQRTSTRDRRQGFAVITDSAADIPDEDLERLDIHMVPCRVQFGERSYLDKVSISTEAFFEQLARSDTPATTSQPAPGDFRRQFQHLASHFDDVISINLTPQVSGTFQAAESAATRTNANGRIHVINSQNASVGQGQLVVFAAECAKAGLDADATIAMLNRIIPRTTTYALVRDLQYAVRGGRVPSSRKWVADWLKLTPVLRTTTDGRIVTSGVLRGRKDVLPGFARYIARHAGQNGPKRLSIGHAICEDDALALQSLLETVFPEVERCHVTAMGSAIGAHGGPGSLVVSVQDALDPKGAT